MKKKSIIPIRGIERNNSITDVEPGSMYDIQNLRPKDKAWRPVPQKAIESSFYLTGATPIGIYCHDSLPNNEYIAVVRLNTGYIRVWHIRLSVSDSVSLLGAINLKTLRLFSPDEEIWDIAYIDNILMITSSKDVTFHVYKGGEYLLNKSLSSLKMPSFFIKEGSKNILPPSGQGGVISTLTNTSWSGLLANYFELRDDSLKENYIEGEFFAILAWKLKDGTYIKHGSPIYVSLPYMYRSNRTYFPESRASFLMNIDGDESQGIPFRMDYPRFSKGIAALENIALSSDWGSVIESLCVFITPPQHIYNMSADEKQYTIVISSITNSPTRWLPKRNNCYDYFKASLFYKSAEFTFSELTGDTEKQLVFKDIVTKEALPPDQLSHHALLGRKSLLYNGRLHIANIDTVLYNGHTNLVDAGNLNFTDWINPNYEAVDDTDSSLETIYIETDISLYSGDYTTRTIISGTRKAFLFNIDAYGATPIYRYFTVFWPIITYPHPNASKIKFWMEKYGKQQLIGEFALEKHDFYSFSFYLDKNVFPLFFMPYITTPQTVNRDTAPAITSRYSDSNRLQASGIGNPLYYPTANSYQIGDDDSNNIKWMKVQSTPTSEGQFGQFPLIIGSGLGIHVLDQGQGEVLYSSMRNISKLIPNDNAIGLDFGVIFSTANGLFAIQGRNVVEIGQGLRSALLAKINSQYDTNGPIPANNNFNTFLQNCIYAFDYLHSELIMLNKDFTFCIRLSTSNPAFFRTTEHYTNALLRKGRYIAYDMYGTTITVRDMDVDDLTEPYIPVHFATNPVNHGDYSLVKLIQSRLLGVMQTTSNVGGLLFRIFGSTLRTIRIPNTKNIYAEFSRIQQYITPSSTDIPVPITADTTLISTDTTNISADMEIVEIDGGDIRTIETSLLTSRASQSVFYMIYKFTGSVKRDSTISHIETVFDTRFEEKMK